MLNRKLSSLGKEAEGIMVRMKEFKAVREYERGLLKELTAKKNVNTN